MEHKGYKIERHSGGVGYVVTSPDGRIVSSQPNEESARKWVDEHLAMQENPSPPRGKPGP
jgi:hypothetical protein